MPAPVTVNSRNPLLVQADRMQAVDRQIAALGRQIAVGERFTDPSEDPAGANRAGRLERLESRLEADQRSLGRASDRLSLAETASGTAAEALLRARELALLAANDTLSPEDRQVIAREAEVLAGQILAAANARDESGRQLFGGARDTAPPFVVLPDGSVAWQGEDRGPGAEAAGIAGVAVPTGPLLFGAGETSAFAAMAALSAALAEPDPALRRTLSDTAIGQLEQASNRLFDGQARIGAARARLEQEGERLAAARLQTSEAIAAVKGLDMTAAISRLDALRTTLEAAQGSFVRIYDGTLFDRLG